MTSDAFKIGWAKGSDKTSVRLSHLNVGGFDFPILIDMTLPDDRLYLVTYNERGEVREKIEVRISDAIRDSQNRGSAK